MQPAEVATPHHAVEQGQDGMDRPRACDVKSIEVLLASRKVAQDITQEIDSFWAFHFAFVDEVALKAGWRHPTTYTSN
ncbi:hypothetical protein PsYK624_168070 [Phanerochaete sordida]|uniref:Uncharacterized protein n=1 Tax=Phanerochaete sordida TaxID=48140 RepID=A0A9P3GT58_9APHY|nr:hypothetical protein PsYK624_168070 [Phanerochaete sordida]